MPRILDHSKDASQRHAAARKTRTARTLPALWAPFALAVLLVAASGVAAQEPTETPEDAWWSEPPVVQSDMQSCNEPGTNTQCNEFGSITMPSQREIRGSPTDIDAVLTLSTLYADNNARWILFTIHNRTQEGESPVVIALTSFSTPYGDVIPTRTEQPKPSELNLWVDVLDMSVDTPITLSARVGATERGAYTLEMLVMPFDRGYSPIKDAYGNDQSLYSFTLLGVNKETSGGGTDSKASLLDGKKVPGLEAVAVLSLVAAVAVIVGRRRSA